LPAEPQLPLLAAEAAAPPEAEPRVRRTTSKGIAPGDIVLVDKRGRRFHAVVVRVSQADSSRYELDLRPLESGISFRQATVREVVEVWRKAGRSAA
jgi:ASC-1-like (ASCH) protein